MLNIGAGELLVLGLIALIVLGPDKLPEAARKVGQVVTEFRKVSSGFQAELRDALHEPVDTTPSTGNGSAVTRSPTPKAPPPPATTPGDVGAPDAADPADGAAIDPSDWNGGTAPAEPADDTERPDGPGHRAG